MLSFSGYYLLTHKAGECAEDCQDAIVLDAVSGVIALADGVGQSFFPKTWSRALANIYARSRINADYRQDAWLSEAQDLWREHIKCVMENAKSGKNADIWTLNSFNKGEPALSTFLGVIPATSGNNEHNLLLKIEAMGDTCLLYFSKGRLKQSFPLANSDFPVAPHAISSIPTGRQVNLETAIVTLQEGDRLVVATDAFAKFLFRACENNSPLIGEFLDINSKEGIVEFISRCRSAKGFYLEDDDIALASLVCSHEKSHIDNYSFSTPFNEPDKKSDGKDQPEEHRENPSVQPLPSTDKPEFDPALDPPKTEAGAKPYFRDNQETIASASLLLNLVLLAGIILIWVYFKNQVGSLRLEISTLQNSNRATGLTSAPKSITISPKQEPASSGSPVPANDRPVKQMPSSTNLPVKKTFQ
jgi:hypothetical protein